jgi:predicted ATPase/DNA-binding winged helix-turn-helix (wHTH) protein
VYVGSSEKVLTFGPFELYRDQKLLLEAGKSVRLSSRALEILVALVERAGEVVSKNELLAYAWPGTLVEESNLRVHVAALRKILGDGQAGVRYIVNVSGRGYSFVAPVNRTQTQVEPATPETRKRSILPAPLTRAVGREDVVSTIAAQVLRRRFVTIVGPGGVGKSTVALAVAEQLVESNAHRAVFVDLSVVEHPALLPAAVASIAGVTALSGDPVASLLAFFRDERLLLVLDNCEHVIAAVAELIEKILPAAPEIDILATSREPVLAEGESLHRLLPLELPPDTIVSITATAVLPYPAIQLFVERATHRLDTFELTDANAAAVTGICRRLDGIPLAIELAAARVDSFGVQGLASRLDDRFFLLTRGRRTARPRHQSLQSTLDWSYETLSAIEQTVLRRLAVFRGPFSQESAAAVVAGNGLTSNDVLNEISSLAGKSLLTTDVSGNTIHYRLLHITRAYAFERLESSGEQEDLQEAHAEHYRTVLETAQADWETLTRLQWLSRYDYMIADVRAALDWAFGPGGDIQIGASLTVGAVPFGYQLASVDVLKQLSARALESLAQQSPRNLLAELRLNVALGEVTQNTSGPEELISTTYARAIALSEELGIPRYKVGPRMHRVTLRLENGDYAGAVEYADELSVIAKASDDPLSILLADRVCAQANHFAGRHDRAWLLAERVLRHPAFVVPFAYAQAYVDRKVAMRIILSRILWIEGHPDQAADVAAECLELAASDSPFSSCQALALAACPIAFWRGDEAAAEALTAGLLDITRRYTMTRWHTLGQCFRATLDEGTGGDAQPREPLIQPFSCMQRDLLTTLSERWLDAGTLARADAGLSGWCMPEVLRLAGLSQLRQGAVSAAQTSFESSLRLAREQQALGWELRSATSLAQLWHAQGRPSPALEMLGATYERFSEGHATADLKSARHLLETLNG